MEFVDSIVAKTSPGLYAAANQANLSSVEGTQISQMSYAIQKNKELNAMSLDKAKSAYDGLDPDIQKGLKSLFKNAEYLKEPPTVGNRVLGVLKTGFNILASPLIGLLKVAGEYNRVINAPYLVAREVAQGEGSIFSKKVWSEAWDGRSVYDHGALKEATDYFGAPKVFVAKGILAGKTPGEIVQEYGKVDKDILAAITQAYDDPNNFRQVLDGVKYSQVSFGRDIARSMLHTMPPKSGGLHGDYISSAEKNLSGVLDFSYQIAIDPLTWMTGGAGKALTLGNRLAKTIEEGAAADNVGASIAKVFEHPQVYGLWQDQLGPALKKISEATTTAEKSLAEASVAKNFPGYNNPAAIKTFVDNKLFDAKSAQGYFEQSQNAMKMISGRVDGMTYKRNGVVVAKKHRNVADGLTTFLDSIFNNTQSKTLGSLKSNGRDVAELQAKGEPLIQALTKVGEMQDHLANPTAEMQLLIDTSKEITGLKKFGQLAARSPVGLEIRTGERASETAGNFFSVARQLLPRDLAQMVTTHFVSAPEEEQFVIARNLYTAIMLKHGLGGHPEGLQLIEKTLSNKFGGKPGFGTLVNTPIPKDFVKEMETGSVKADGMLDTSHPTQIYHSTNVIGSLPYKEIAQAVADAKAKKNIFFAMKGATSSKFASNMVDAWSFMTLFPRLGVRSAIDEGLMFVLTAPAKDLRAFASRQGHRMGKMSTAFTASEKAVGPVREALNKIPFLGKHLPVTANNAIKIVERQQLLEAFAKKHNIEVELLTDLQKRTAVAERVMDLYGKHVKPEDQHYILQGLVHSPDMLESMAASVVGSSGLSGRQSEEILSSIITPTAVDLMYAETGIGRGSVSRNVPTSSLTDGQIMQAHFDKWHRSFAGNFNRDLNPGYTFFSNNGLKPGELATDGSGRTWFAKAKDELSENAGLKFDRTTGKWVVRDKTKADDFRNLSSHTVDARQRGLDDAAIVREQIDIMLVDLYNTFHGGTEYNQKLMDLMKSKYRYLDDLRDGIATDAEGKLLPSQQFSLRKIWNIAAASIDHKAFEEATRGFRPVGEINTYLEFPGVADTESMFRKLGNKGMEWMDRQVNAMYRQPAIHIAYVDMRKKYAGAERQYAKDLFDSHVKAEPKLYVNKEKQTELRNRVNSIAEKYFTEMAARDAADTVLKYADNPAIRSNFAYSLRTVGRYYRATEDFQRRIYRMGDVKARVLHRMRLAHLGLEASGDIYQDPTGSYYVTLPMDNIIFKATDTTIRTLTGNTGYSQPLFNDFTLKLNMLNPSFQQDSGLPTLSGPIAGLSVVAMKSILGGLDQVPFIGKAIGPEAKRLGNWVDTAALGNIGDNVDIVRAIVPPGLTKLYAMLPFNEQSRQEVTAAQQAIAYNAAHGRYLDANSTDKEKAEYLNNIRISAHNVLFLRNFLGLAAPATPTMMETKDMPDYLRKVGMTGLRSEFYDILDGISKASRGTVQDPYELALATYTGKHPGRLIYTVSRDQRETRVIVKNTEELNQWGISNSDFIKTYGQAAYIFAPQVGKFNAASYNWMQAAGLIKNKTLEQYYTDLLVAQDKQTYYDIGTQEKAAIAELSAGNQAGRSRIYNEAADARQLLKNSNPLLEAALMGTGSIIGIEGQLLNSLDQIIADPKSPVDSGTRMRMASAIKMIKDYQSFATDTSMKNAVNFSQMKRERKYEIEAAMKDLMSGDPNLIEANRAVFQSILDFYSRDAYSVPMKGM